MLAFVSRCRFGFKEQKKNSDITSNLAFERVSLAAVWRKDWRGGQVNMGEVVGNCSNIVKNDFVIDFPLNAGCRVKGFSESINTFQTVRSVYLERVVSD